MSLLVEQMENATTITSDANAIDDTAIALKYDLLLAKCTAMVCMFLATVVLGSLPYVLNHYFQWTKKNATMRTARLVQCLLHFGGGVLLATTLIHLLPEVQEVIEHLQGCHQLPEVEFPLAETLICAGFFLMYFIEECIHNFLHRYQTHSKNAEQQVDVANAAFQRGHSIRNSVLMKAQRLQEQLKEEEEEKKEKKEHNSIIDHHQFLYPHDHLHRHEHEHHIHQRIEDLNNPNNSEDSGCDTSQKELNVLNVLPPQKSIASHLHNDYELRIAVIEHDAQHDHNHNHNYNQQNNFHKRADVNCQPINNAKDCHTHSHNYHATPGGHSHLPPAGNPDDNLLSSSLRGLFIVVALSLHEIFEGLAIGLEDSASSVWFLFAAVSAHKLVLAFCIGVELIVAQTRLLLVVIYTVTFAVVSPLGILVGILVTSEESGDELTEGMVSFVLQGLACGTLLYVVFFEILSKQHSGLSAFVAMLCGFLVMFGLQMIGK